MAIMERAARAIRICIAICMALALVDADKKVGNELFWYGPQPPSWFPPKSPSPCPPPSTPKSPPSSPTIPKSPPSPPKSPPSSPKPPKSPPSSPKSPLYSPTPSPYLPPLKPLPPIAFPPISFPKPPFLPTPSPNPPSSPKSPGYGGPGYPGTPSGGHGGGCPCTYWSSHFGSWPPALKNVITIGDVFGPTATKEIGDITLLSALQTTKTDPYNSLIRQGVTALLNSHKVATFLYTPDTVKSTLNAAMVSSQAASVQAVKFEQANNGYGMQGSCV